MIIAKNNETTRCKYNKHVQDLQTENHKMLIKKSKKI